MPHYLSSLESGSLSPSPSHPPPTQDNSLPSSHTQESEDFSHLTHPVYFPQPNGDQRPSQPIVGYHSTANGTSAETSNLLSHHPEVTQPSVTQTPPYAYQPQPSRLYQARFDSPYSFTPAPTASNIYNRRNRSGSDASVNSSSSSVSQNQPSAFIYPHMLSRFLTVNPAESPLAHEERRAISEGFVQEGDDILARRIAEQGWISSSHSDEHVEQGSQEGSDGSRTMGRSREGTARERSVDETSWDVAGI